jgi:hypothetical protein
MNATLESLQLRVQKLEQEMAALRQLVMNHTVTETPAERGRRLVDQARREKQTQRVAAAQAFAQMELESTPAPPAQLRQMMAVEGIRPEDNLFRRGIEEMREE